MKKLVALGLILIILVLPLSSCKNKNQEVLNIYNWGDYIDMETIKKFEDEFNVKVIYNTFASNEDMYVAIKRGGTSYDVAFPSDYMIERMRKEGLLEKIDKDIVKNIKYIDPDFMNLEFDPNNEYSIPYFWGTVGLAYNKKQVPQEDVDSWDVLWNPKYEKEIFMLDSQRDAFAIALKKLGYSMNSRDFNELNQAKEELIKQKPLVYAYIGDEVKDLMVAEEAKIAVVWSGDATAMVWENEDIAYSIPKEGTNLWFDNMVIPKGSSNKELANEFINFMNRPDIAAKNSEYIGYATPNLEAKNLLPEDMRDDSIAYPDKNLLENVEVFQDPKDIVKIYNEMWVEVKSYNN